MIKLILEYQTVIISLILPDSKDYLRFDRASKGEVTLNKSLDYETMQSFVVEIRALVCKQWLRIL